MRVLAVETSCDDTSVAVVTEDGRVEALSSANQDPKHRPFGGIVPEIACRNHTLNLIPLMETALSKAGRTWSDVDGLVVTSRPGLVGSLIVGLVTVKTLALAHDIPFVGVNHLEGHLMAPFLRDEDYQPPAELGYPFLALAVSGGHSHIYSVESFGHYQTLGQTIDDAAGEAFDKFGKRLGLGFPGGVQVDRWAANGDPKAYKFPRPLIKEEHCNLSFSGLKTAANRQLETMEDSEVQDRLADLCASYREAIVDVLMTKLDRAHAATGHNSVVITGGVSANSRLRQRAEEWAAHKKITLAIPPLRYCTDNAAMIGWAGLQRLQRGEPSDQEMGPSPRSLKGDFLPLKES